ncbi:MAG: hypothetical protein A2X86_21705 [Bdellovibrionales bacterium GWA2_49_15]|nr:MAG: hypothetical protein A2X86_21705 [Bdellovibrionales bacterium GWA2_49_15]HAZ11583.1 hypothetical protein [Bdellovibrionales bacterium]
MASQKELDKVYDEIFDSMGFLADGYKKFSKEAIPGAWKEMKDFEMNPETDVPNKYKQLINLAVASQIPSTYCVTVYNKMASMEGASEEEISEAVSLASLVRRFSTFINGAGLNLETFKNEVDQIVTFVKGQQASGKKGALKEIPLIETSAHAFKDMDHTLGLTPSFFRAYPEAGVAGVWREFKELQLNPATSIPNKYKELIGLGVAAQIPCSYCLHFHTEASKLHGATTGEIYETAAIAGNARHWSAAFNGLQKEYGQFEKDLEQAMKRVEQKQKTKSRL